MQTRSTRVEALVLNTKPIGETDRIITLLCQKFGKTTTLAKGVRKPSSSASGSLQPGNIVSCLLIKTKSWPLLTQAKLLQDTGRIRGKLSLVKQLLQVLEILDILIVEEELTTDLFKQCLSLRNSVTQQESRQVILKQISQIIAAQGYPRPDLKKINVGHYLQQIIGKKVKSFEFLSP